MKLKGLEGIKQGVAHLRDSVADGWQKVWQLTVGALMRFRLGKHTGLPARDGVDDSFYGR